MERTKKNTEADRIINTKEAIELTSLSYSELIRREKLGNFPKRIPLGPSRVGYSLREILDWIEDRKRERKSSTPTKHKNGHHLHIRKGVKKIGRLPKDWIEERKSERVKDRSI